MDPARIAVRAIVAYAYLLFTTRASGKRAVAQATPFDFVLALVLGDLIDDALWAEVSISRFAGAVGAICVLDVIVKMLSSRFDGVHKLVGGTPRVVLRDGRPVRGEMRRDQLDTASLEALLRLQDTDRWDEVRVARVELDGELSVEKQDWAEPAQRKDAPRVKDRLR